MFDVSPWRSARVIVRVLYSMSISRVVSRGWREAYSGNSCHRSTGGARLIFPLQVHFILKYVLKSRGQQQFQNRIFKLEEDREIYKRSLNCMLKEQHFFTRRQGPMSCVSSGRSQKSRNKIRTKNMKGFFLKFGNILTGRKCFTLFIVGSIFLILEGSSFLFIINAQFIIFWKFRMGRMHYFKSSRDSFSKLFASNKSL